jgi:hypothetical protein
VAQAMADLRGAVVEAISADPSVQLHQHIQRAHVEPVARSRTA